MYTKLHARLWIRLQGDIESYAAMSPKDLTDRFEHISGSEQHRKQYHELEQQKLKAEEQTSFLFSKRKTVTQEKKQKKEQKDEAEKHVRMQQELVSHDSSVCSARMLVHARRRPKPGQRTCDEMLESQLCVQTFALTFFCNCNCQGK